MIAPLRLLWIGLAAGLCSLAAEASAGTHADMQVSAEIVSGCEVAPGNWGALDFGTQSALSSGVVATSFTSTVQLNCTPGLTLLMKVDGGLYGRQLQHDGGGERIAYRLFTDAARSLALGVDQMVPVPLGQTGAVVLPIHAELNVPAQRPAGTYSDVLQVQLIW